MEIEQLFRNTFSESDSESEGALIGKLAHDLMTETEPAHVFGHVATENEEVIGSIFFTRMWFDTSVTVFLLAPVAVRTDYQGRGVGQRLINFGIDQLRQQSVNLLFTYGDPNYYSKVGFEQVSEDIVRAPLELTQPEGWLCQSLDGSDIEQLPGKPRCVEALNRPEYW